MSSSSSTIPFHQKTIPSFATNRKDSSRVSLPYLPDDLLLNCLARVLRLHHPTLSLVSKRFRSLLASNELSKTRKLLGRTESCLYMCLLGETNPRFFTLYQRPTSIPNPSPNFNKSIGNGMVSIRTHNYSPTHWWDQVTVGSSIYIIDGHIPDVFFFDCRSHTWNKAPSMQVSRTYPKVSVLDGKIYVTGDYRYSDPSNLIGCFDPETQKWEHVPIPDAYLPVGYIYKSLAVDGNLYIFGKNKTVVYKPKEDKWDTIGLNELLYMVLCSICVIDDVLYCYGLSRRIEWYDFEERSWRVLKGLENLPTLPKYYSYVKLVNYGGKIAVLWEDDVYEIGLKKIWCAEIALEKPNKEEIYGKIEWCDVVLTVSNSCDVKQFTSVTI